MRDRPPTPTILYSKRPASRPSTGTDREVAVFRSPLHPTKFRLFARMAEQLT
jgi:hypothetical protein